MISAKIIADSKNLNGDRLTTFVLTFPRIILAEFNTHRVFSRNSASSRAIPFKKMVSAVKENPFVPIAWQKDHSGMQGKEYFSKTEKFDIGQFMTVLSKVFDGDQKLVDYYTDVLEGWAGTERTLDEWWLIARDLAVESSVMLSCFGATKQLCNRILEPFIWHTVIVTATEYENFFKLRSPQYSLFYEQIPRDFRSKKDFLNFVKQVESPEFSNQYDNLTDLDWFLINKGQAEIHIMALAEAMWDAYNESEPKLLQDGEWHVPFGDKFDINKLKELMPEIQPASLGWFLEYMDELRVKIATARCARVSYTIVGEEGKPDNYQNDLKLHDRLAESGHASPFEHSAKAMCGVFSRNFVGFQQYREICEL
jgi:hypothetical protein